MQLVESDALNQQLASMQCHANMVIMFGIVFTCNKQNYFHSEELTETVAILIYMATVVVFYILLNIQYG